MRQDSFEVAMLIKEIYANTMGTVSKSLRESGLTNQQIMVIKLIAHNKQVNISQLCEEMSLSKGTISGIVARLEKADYVKKIKDENDKRNTYVAFSDKGFEFAKNFIEEINGSFDKVFENFTEEEVKQVKDALTKLRNKIKENK
ncbi:MarR family winged helix-turn-helix transcriptional regulator [Clostridium neonatale]|uniref:HTH-type transcriptional regulator SarZ n=1 Tax=Clostridium neonatale TaxID=137838 RepID=A0A650M6A5_9CLOT|nr:MarR family transcriptional regulator [Clostridium neonatale]MBP8314043.1 MarR family transcriptional regulator [Clostridium neonatale]CAG9710501.1 Putative transcriptional regulator, MarR family [Clostridium neonatale]CAI3570813.1 putative transcriptional regulator, MarR family [Clostridium neonatale]CAI3602043.1 putative transcriptional regulator, MarR family [Clostridium neonatale]CAI3647292.1 putative transcriptional regulator, MarR family [Clostridium neonatale]